MPYTLRKRNQNIAAVNKQYIKRTHKFGIEALKSLEIDKENGNNLWRDVISKQMHAVKTVFKI